jgi:hypothetical protein
MIVVCYEMLCATELLLIRCVNSIATTMVKYLVKTLPLNWYLGVKFSVAVYSATEQE